MAFFCAKCDLSSDELRRSWKREQAWLDRHLAGRQHFNMGKDHEAYKLHTQAASQQPPTVNGQQQQQHVEMVMAVAPSQRAPLYPYPPPPTLKRQLGDSHWYNELLTLLSNGELDFELVDFVRNALIQHDSNAGEFPFTTIEGLRYQLVNGSDRLDTARGQLESKLEDLDDRLDANADDLVELSSLCHLRPGADGPTNSCPVCETDSLFEDYEARLYAFTPDQHSRDDAETVVGVGGEQVAMLGRLRRGTWHPSPLERALRAVGRFAKNHRARLITLADLDTAKRLTLAADTAIRLFAAHRNHFTAMRTHWMAISDHVAKRDELCISTERMRLATNEEVVAWRADQSAMPLNAIRRFQIEQKLHELEGDLIDARGRLDQKTGQLRYLETLRRSEACSSCEGLPEGVVDEPCPICRGALGVKWVVLACAHRYCFECYAAISRPPLCQSENIKCPVCRRRTDRVNVTYVMAKSTRPQDDIPVKGSYSTKVEEIVRCLLRIRQAEPVAKCLVFSGWVEVLALLSKALTENDISHLNIAASAGRQKIMNRFRSEAGIQTLLLPMRSGANGLNVTEATHVLLVEPQLNAAAELQAVGRIHRLGQRRRTTLHRFLLRSSVEQRLVDMLGANSSEREKLDSDQEVPITVAQFSELFQE